MSPPVLTAANSVRDFLFEKVYTPSTERAEAEKAKKVVHDLYAYFIEHEDKLPPEYRLHGETTARRVVDYIAGMTDQYALALAEKLL
jgi:dGTPase